MMQKPVASATQVILNDAVANRRKTRRGYLVAKQDDEQMQGRAKLPRQHFEIGRLKKIKALGVPAPHRLVINPHELRHVALLVVVDRYDPGPPKLVDNVPATLAISAPLFRKRPGEINRNRLAHPAAFTEAGQQF